MPNIKQTKHETMKTLKYHVPVYKLLIVTYILQVEKVSIVIEILVIS